MLFTNDLKTKASVIRQLWRRLLSVMRLIMEAEVVESRKGACSPEHMWTAVLPAPPAQGEAAGSHDGGGTSGENALTIACGRH